MLVLAIFAVGVAQAKGFRIQPERKTLQPSPTLERVIVYTWAMNTAAISVDLQSGDMECFHPGCSKPEYAAFRKTHPKGFAVTRIRAALRSIELKAIRSIVMDSGLRRFEPSGSDVKKRCPNFDECPPTIVLVWSDRKQVLNIPLDDTVKPTLPVWRKGCYNGMDELYERVEETIKSYDRKPFVSVLPAQGPEYRHVEKERERMLKR